ncbi:MAG: ribosome-associated translation inhibitor RaiA [bacterium]|nr:ribosome-associated translation inhibitor RaiA [bacterium]
MQVSVTFRHMPTSDALRDHAIEKVANLKKFLDDATEAHVVLSIEHFRHKADVNLTSHGMQIRGKETSEDMYSSIDRAIAKIETQVKKYKSRMTNHHPREGARKKFQFNLLQHVEIEQIENSNHLPPTVIETKEIDARPMIIEEAVMQMDLLQSDILVYLNSKTENLNILYRKKNNKYGLIETHSN